MTDRVNKLTVVLEKDIRIDDVQSLIDAINHLKGVAAVTPGIVDSTTAIARMRVGNDLRLGLMNFVDEFLILE